MGARERRNRLFGYLTLLLLFVATPGCSNNEIPEALYGEWITEHPQYADCKIEITEEWIIFSKGLTHKLFYSITDVEDITPPTSDQTLYALHYEDKDGYEYTLSFFYDSTREGDVLQLKHQGQVRWHRKTARGSGGDRHSP